MGYATVTPAYGRDYKSAKEAKADFADGKDFILQDFMSPWDGKPCSIRCLGETYTHVTIRFGKMRNVTVVTL
jgi:hypothetical protein